MIVVIDYGMGNLRSVSKALEALGASVCVSSDPKDVAASSKLILPGVGAFGAAMRELSARRLIEPIHAALASGKPYLGICLGLQLLLESSEEDPGTPGLGRLKGAVKRFAVDDGLKVPHMGWNQLIGSGRSCPLLAGIPERSFVYFVHSYYADPADRSVVVSETEYGQRFVSMVWAGNLFATQFHPEKSQAVGLRLLENFVKL